MRIAITGGTGFVGSHLANRLRAEGHEVVVLSGRTGNGLEAGADRLAGALVGCEAVVHCAGINREIGDQSYEAVHVRGTATVIDAARTASVTRIVMVSFLRARADGPTTYHRSKWAAEEVVRQSGPTHTILKAGVIHGRGDHMLDHLSHAFHTFPIFGLADCTNGLSGRSPSTTSHGSCRRRHWVTPGWPIGRSPSSGRSRCRWVRPSVESREQPVGTRS